MLLNTEYWILLNSFETVKAWKEYSEILSWAISGFSISSVRYVLCRERSPAVGVGVRQVSLKTSFTSYYFVLYHRMYWAISGSADLALVLHVFDISCETWVRQWTAVTVLDRYPCMLLLLLLLLLYYIVKNFISLLTYHCAFIYGLFQDGPNILFFILKNFWYTCNLFKILINSYNMTYNYFFSTVYIILNLEQDLQRLNDIIFWFCDKVVFFRKNSYLLSLVVTKKIVKEMLLSQLQNNIWDKVSKKYKKKEKKRKERKENTRI